MAQTSSSPLPEPVTQVEWLKTLCTWEKRPGVSAKPELVSVTCAVPNPHGVVCGKTYQLTRGFATPASFVAHLKSVHGLEFRKGKKTLPHPASALPAKTLNLTGDVVEGNRLFQHIPSLNEAALLSFVALIEGQAQSTKGVGAAQASDLDSSLGHQGIEGDEYRSQQFPPPLLVRLLTFFPRTTRDPEVLNPSHVPSPKKLLAYKDLLQWRSEPELMLKGLIPLRKLLSKEKDVPIDAVLSDRIVEDVVAICLESEGTPLPWEVPFEAAWVLTNVVSAGEPHFSVAFEQKALEGLSALLDSFPDNPKIINQALWGLGNIAGETPGHRDLSLAAVAPTLTRWVALPAADNDEILEPLRHLFRRGDSTFLEIAWSLGQLVRGNPPPPDQPAAERIFVILCVAFDLLLKSSPNSKILSDCLWSLSFVLQGNLTVSLVEGRFLGPADRFLTLLQLLRPGSKQDILNPATRILGSLVEKSDVFSTFVCQRRHLRPIADLTSALAREPRRTSATDATIKELLWTISNMATVESVANAMLKETNFVADLCTLVTGLTSPLNVRQRQETTWWIETLLNSANRRQLISHFADPSVLPTAIVTALLDSICNPHSATTQGVSGLRSLHKLLTEYKGRATMRALGGALGDAVQAIEQLQSSGALTPAVLALVEPFLQEMRNSTKWNLAEKSTVFK